MAVIALAGAFFAPKLPAKLGSMVSDIAGAGVRPKTDVELAWQTCFALMQQQTGLAFDPYWLGELRPTYVVTEPHWLYWDVPNAEKS